MPAASHGHTAGRKFSGTYSSWAAMISRCHNERAAAFKSYGAKGIRVCDRWRSFEAFLADMGERPAGTTIDRIDNARGYEPGNCRWATRAEQDANRAPRKLIEMGGRVMSLGKWARELGLHRTTLQKRLQQGLPPEKVLLAQRLDKGVPKPRALSAAQIDEAKRQLAAGRSQTRIAKEFGVNKNVIYRIDKARRSAIA